MSLTLSVSDRFNVVVFTTLLDYCTHATSLLPLFVGDDTIIAMRAMAIDMVNINFKLAAQWKSIEDDTDIGLDLF